MYNVKKLVTSAILTSDVIQRFTTLLEIDKVLHRSKKHSIKYFDIILINLLFNFLLIFIYRN